MDTSQAQAEDVQTALLLCVGNAETQRYNLDGTKLLIKTNQSQIDNLLEEWGGLYTWEQIMSLTFSVEYTKENLKPIITSDTWQNNEL